MWFIIFPKSRVLVAIMKKELSKSIFLWIFEGSSIKRAIRINKDIIFTHSFSLIEPSFKEWTIMKIDTPFTMGQSI